MFTEFSESENSHSDQIPVSTSTSTELTQADLCRHICFSPPPPFKFPSGIQYSSTSLPKYQPVERYQLENDSTLFLKEITYKQKK